MKIRKCKPVRKCVDYSDIVSIRDCKRRSRIPNMILPLIHNSDEYDNYIKIYNEIFITFKNRSQFKLFKKCTRILQYKLYPEHIFSMVKRQQQQHNTIKHHLYYNSIKHHLLYLKSDFYIRDTRNAMRKRKSFKYYK